MKNFFLRFLLFAGTLITPFYSVFGQGKTPADSTKAKDSAISNISSRLDEIYQMLKAAKADEREKTGILRFDTLRPVTIYTANGKKTSTSILIDRINIQIQDGYILNIEIFSGNRTFTNTRSPISIDGKRFSRTGKYYDLLQNKHNKDEFIILQESVIYEPLSGFAPEDGLLHLTRKNAFDTLSKNVGVNTVLDLRLYTDALATLGDEPNGIFLTDLRFKQFLHRKHYINSGMRILQYLKVNLTASKLDSKYSFVDSSDQLSRSQLMQRSKFNAELLMNLYSSWLGRKTLSTYYLDAGAGFSNVNLARSKDTITIKTQNLFLEGGLNLKSSSNIGFDFYVRGIVQYSPSTSFNKQDSASRFLRFGGEVYWNPFGDPASRIFARITYTKGLNSFENRHSFSQVQLGYSTLLSKAIGKK